MQSDMTLEKLCLSLQWITQKLPGSFAYCRLYRKEKKTTGKFERGICLFELVDAVSKLTKQPYLKEAAMMMLYVDPENKRIGLIDPEWRNKNNQPNKPFYYIKLFERILPELVAYKF